MCRVCKTRCPDCGIGGNPPDTTMTTSNHTARRRNKNLGDGIDYGQQHYECLGELISNTLQLLEQRGGPDAYINIK